MLSASLDSKPKYSNSHFIITETELWAHLSQKNRNHTWGATAHEISFPQRLRSLGLRARQNSNEKWVLVAQSCLTLWEAMDCSPPSSTVCGILQARILERVATPSSRGSSQPRDQTRVSYIAGEFFTIWGTREAKNSNSLYQFSEL